MHQFFLYVFKHLYLVRGLNDARNATILTICGYNQKCNRSRIKRSKNLHDMWILNVTSYLPSQLHLWVAQSYQLTFVCVSYNVLLLPFLSRDWDPLLEFLCENFVSVLLWDWQHIKKEIQWLTTLFFVYVSKRRRFDKNFFNKLTNNWKPPNTVYFYQTNEVK